MYYKQVTIEDIANFLHEYGYSIMLYSENDNVQLFKLKEWFTSYYSDSAIDFDTWIINTFGNFVFVDTSLFPSIEDIKDKTKWNNTLLNNCINFLKSQYNSVSLIHEYEMEKLFATTLVEYNPIENYSMTESGTDTETTSSTSNVQNPTQTNTSEMSVSPSDSATYKPKEKNVDTTSYDGKIISDTGGTNKNVHEFKRSGNIGVTTTQDMLISERKVAEFSLFSHYWTLLHNYSLILIDDSADWNDCIFG